MWFPISSNGWMSAARTTAMVVPPVSGGGAVARTHP
jgi:hypothetical protein